MTARIIRRFGTRRSVRCSVDYDQIRRTDQIVDPLRRAPARQWCKIKTDRLGSELPSAPKPMCGSRRVQHERRILVIVPSNLRKQWHQELSEKFFRRYYITRGFTFGEAFVDHPNPIVDKSAKVIPLPRGVTPPSGYKSL